MPSAALKITCCGGATAGGAGCTCVTVGGRIGPGIGGAGVYTFEVAETKVTKTMHLAKAQQFPLQLSIEPTD